MPRPIGLAKTGGRKKGTPNKNSLALAERLEAEGFDVVRRLIDGMESLTPSERAHSLLKLMEYIYPKRGHFEARDLSNEELRKVLVERILAREKQAELVGATPDAT